MPGIVAIFLGALAGLMVGAMGHELFATVMGALVLWLLVRARDQKTLIEALRARADAIEAAFRQLAAVPRAAPMATAAAPIPGAPVAAKVVTADEATHTHLLTPAAQAAAEARASGLVSTLQPTTAFVAAPEPWSDAVPITAPLPVREASASTRISSSVVSPAAPSRSTPPRPPAPPLNPDWFDRARAWFFGGNTIVKVGVGILFIGLAFLAKYASEHVQVPVEFRLMTIGGVAIALLVVGWRLRHSRAGYAQVLQGGAVAALYLTLFVAFKFYGVIAGGPVFAMMAMVSALAAALAVLQDARALAVIGALGGFAAPILTSDGSGNYIGLFGYYLVLDLGIAAVAWYRTWRVLNLIGFFCTFVVGTAWGLLKYNDTDFAASESFLVAFFVLFIAIMLMPARHLTSATEDATTPTPSRDGWVNSSLLFALPTIVFALQYGLVHDMPYGAAFSALGFGAFYVALAMWMRSRPALGLTFDASLGIAALFLTLVIPFALDARSVAGAWTLEGAGLVWIGFRQQRGVRRAFGYTLLVFAGCAMVFGHERHGVPTAYFNAYLFNGVMAAAASLAAACLAYRHRAVLRRDRGEDVIEPLLIGLGSAWIAVTAAIQIHAFVPDRFTVSALLAKVSAGALLYALLRRQFAWPTIGWPTIGLTPFALVVLAGGLFVFDRDLITIGDPGTYGHAWAWAVALVAHLAVLRFVAPGWPNGARLAAHTGGVIVLACWGALQGRVLTGAWGDPSSAWPWLGWLVVPAVLLLLLPKPATLSRWPMRLAPEAYATLASAVIAVGLLAWTVLANVDSDGSSTPLPPIPFLNPLDIGIAIALLAVALWMRSKTLGMPPDRQRQIGIGLGMAGFVWLNAVLVRGFHHYAGVPYRFGDWVDSLAVQTGITLLWSVLALGLMWFSARRAMRLPWVLGAGLLGAVVLKLLLVDLSGSGTVTRIVSFIGVGVLMLVIGYVAPLPTKGEENHVAA